MESHNNDRSTLMGQQMRNVSPDASSHEDLLRQVAIFEESADPNDPEQMKVLAEMKEHVRHIRFNRGDWNRISHFRSWNEYRPPKPKPPLTIESYRSYKEETGQGSQMRLEMPQGVRKIS